MSAIFPNRDNLPLLAKARCQDCGKVWLVDDLAAIKHIEQRVCVGEPMPAGECPECGALAQLQEPAR